MTARLLGTMLALTAVLLGVLVVPLGIQTARAERRDLRARVERDATAVAALSEESLEAGGSAPASLSRLARTYLSETGGRIVVVNARGVSVVDPASPIGRDFSSRPEIRTALGGRIASGTRRSHSLGTGLLYVAVPVTGGGAIRGAARITYPTKTADRRVRETWLALVAISALALVVAAGLAVWLARWASRPLVQLEAAATGVADGDLAARAPVDGPPEVRAVAASFNAMVERVQDLLAAQSDFVADASHQLRTPLTALRLRLENLGADDPDASADVDAAAAEVERLSELVDGLLALARADGASAPAELLDARAVVAERVEAWSALAAERGAALLLEDGSQARTRIARERLEQALDNLLANALDAVGDGGRVSLSVARAGRSVEIVVRDDGPGLGEAERQHAFDRFWRGRSTPGTGLGLPIARALVEADGGTVELRDAPGRGLEAVVRYPAA